MGRKMLSLYRKLRAINEAKTSSSLFVPRMEMYGIPKDTVLKIVTSNGGKVVDVQQDGSAGQGWFSFLYCVTK
jgi:hypothetical protein